MKEMFIGLMCYSVLVCVSYVIAPEGVLTINILLMTHEHKPQWRAQCHYFADLCSSEMRDIIFKISCLSLFWVNNNKDVRQTVVKYLLDGRYVIPWQIYILLH